MTPWLLPVCYAVQRIMCESRVRYQYSRTKPVRLKTFVLQTIWYFVTESFYCMMLHKINSYCLNNGINNVTSSRSKIIIPGNSKLHLHLRLDISLKSLPFLTENLKITVICRTILTSVKHVSRSIKARVYEKPELSYTVLSQNIDLLAKNS